MSNKIIGRILVFLIIGLVGVYYLGLSKNAPNREVITNFAECVEAGNAVMESYPEQCRTEEGQTFVNPDQVMPVEPDGGIGDGATPPNATTTDSENVNDDEVVFCTADAKLCPDGSYVGRTGPNCEFVCPGQ